MKVRHARTPGETGPLRPRGALVAPHERCSPSTGSPASAPRRSCAPPASRAARCTTSSPTRPNCSPPSSRPSRATSWTLVAARAPRAARPIPQRAARRRRRLARRLRRPRGPAHRPASRGRPCSAGNAGARSGCATAGPRGGRCLTAAIEAGASRASRVEPLAHVVIGALDEAALYVARARRPDTAARRCAPSSTNCSRASRPRADPRESATASRRSSRPRRPFTCSVRPRDR